MAAFWGSPMYKEKLKTGSCYRAVIYAQTSSREKFVETSFWFDLTSENLTGLNSYPKKAPFRGQHLTLDINIQCNSGESVR
jgi:hypothetical protein